MKLFNKFITTIRLSGIGIEFYAHFELAIETESLGIGIYPPELELEPTALDHSSTVSDFAKVWRFFVNLIIHEFNPNVLIIPSTILSANNHFINRKLGALNDSLFRLIKTLYHSRIRIVSPNLNVNFSATIFVKMVFVFLSMVM